MREIKFRVWNKVNETLHYKVEITILQIFDETEITVRGTGDEENRDCPDTFILQQFTGFKDKNGKEIYEGDILEISYSAGHERDSSYDINGKFKVVFRNGEWLAEGSNLWGNDDESYSVWLETSDYALQRGVEVEIVGNIFENPDLLT